MVAYVRAWQNKLNEFFSEYEKKAFQFNTYIISVLVIFFLQNKSELPSLAYISSLKQEYPQTKVEPRKFKQLLLEFFGFYGKVCLEENVISTHIGELVYLKDQSREAARK